MRSFVQLLTTPIASFKAHLAGRSCFCRHSVSNDRTYLTDNEISRESVCTPDVCYRIPPLSRSIHSNRLEWRSQCWKARSLTQRIRQRMIEFGPIEVLEYLLTPNMKPCSCNTTCIYDPSTLLRIHGHITQGYVLQTNLPADGGERSHSHILIGLVRHSEP